MSGGAHEVATVEEQFDLCSTRRTGNRTASLPAVPSIKIFMGFLFEFTRVCICTICMPGACGGQKSVDSFEIGITDDCEPPCGARN